MHDLYKYNYRAFYKAKDQSQKINQALFYDITIGLDMKCP